MDSLDETHKKPRQAAETVTYHGHLRLSTLLSLQRPIADHPDEMHFIVVHQGIELWFKLVLHDLRRVIRLLDADRLGEAAVVIRRMNQSVCVILEQIHSLRDLPPASFQQFRLWLGSSSGADSVQFREIEALSGLRDEEYLAALASARGGRLPAPIQRALEGHSLAEAHTAAAARAGIADWADFYNGAGASSPFYLLSELLLDYDELWLRWRSDHLALVHRLSGIQIRGTGGTDPGSYLVSTLRHRFFPYLWDLRHRVATRNGAELVR
jgi:tryptophan 2,3-dioxygenase